MENWHRNETFMNRAHIEHGHISKLDFFVCTNWGRKGFNYVTRVWFSLREEIGRIKNRSGPKTDQAQRLILAMRVNNQLRPKANQAAEHLGQTIWGSKSTRVKNQPGVKTNQD